MCTIIFLEWLPTWPASDPRAYFHPTDFPLDPSCGGMIEVKWQGCSAQKTVLCAAMHTLLKKGLGIAPSFFQDGNGSHKRARQQRREYLSNYSAGCSSCVGAVVNGTIAETGVEVIALQSRSIGWIMRHGRGGARNEPIGAVGGAVRRASCRRAGDFGAFHD